MNLLQIGETFFKPKPPFLFLCDDVPEISRAKVFDPFIHSINPLPMDYRRAREFASTLYGDKDLMTYRDGKRALTRMLLNTTRLTELPFLDHEGYEDARDTIDDLLLSPVLSRVLTRPTNFSLRGSVIAHLDRAKLGEFDAFVLGQFLIGQFQGHIVVPDGGFYLRDYHVGLIRQNRLMVGVRSLSELSPKLQQAMLTIEDKSAVRCTHDDALTLAKYRGLIPNTNEHTDFVHSLTLQGA